MDESYLALRNAAGDELFLYVVVDVESLAGRGEVAEYELGQLLVCTLFPNPEHVVHALIHFRPRLIGQQRIHDTLVEAELAPIVCDGEHIVHVRLDQPRVYLACALGEFFHERLLNLGRLRHLVVVHNLGPRQIQLVGGLYVRGLMEKTHKLWQIKELAEACPRPVPRPLRGQLHRRHRLAEVRRPRVEEIHAETTKCVVL